MRGVFVTGTDTGVGKTVFSAGLAWAMRKMNIDVGVMKPFATAKRIFSRTNRSQDVAMLAAAAGVSDSDIELNPSFYRLAASPMMAASLTGQPPPVVQEILRTLKRLSLRHEFLIVEGIGGILVPLTYRLLLADFAKAAGLPVVIITRPSIGTLNHTLLTVNACKNYDLKVAGMVVNMMPKKPGILEKASPEALSKLTGIPILGTIPRLKKPSYASAGRAIQNSIDLESLVSMNF